MQKKYSEITTFINSAIQYREKRGVETKLDFAIDKVISLIKKLPEMADCENKFFSSLNENANRFAETDPKTKVLLKDQHGNLCFTAKSANEKNVADKAALKEKNETIIEFTPYYASELPDGLTLEQFEAFKDFVIKPETIFSKSQFESEQN